MKRIANIFLSLFCATQITKTGRMVSNISKAILAEWNRAVILNNLQEN